MKSRYDFLAIRYQNGKGQNKKIRPFTLLWFGIILFWCVYVFAFLYLPFIIFGIFK